MTDELFDRMRHADPARSLPPVGPDRVDHLLEAAMTTEPMNTSRRPLVWLAAAAAVVVIAGTAFWMNRPAEAPVPPAAQDTVTELQAPPAAQTTGRCAAPNAEMLGNADVAFLGTVTSVADGEVSLEVGEWFRGEETDAVTIEAPPSDLGPLVTALDFEEGVDYYVAANDGTVMLCGFSGPVSDDLGGIYADAFSD